MTLHILRREFIRIVFSKGFLISTFGTPLLILVVLLSLFLPTAKNKLTTSAPGLTSLSDELPSAPVGLFDESGLLNGPHGALSETDENARYIYRRSTSEADEPNPLALPLHFIKIANLSSGTKSLESGRIKALIYIPAGYLETRQVSVITSLNEDGLGPLTFPHQEAVTELLSRSILSSLGVSENHQEVLLKGPDFEQKELIDGQIEAYEVGRNREGLLKRFFELGPHYLLAAMMVMMLFTNSTRLLRSSAEERENKLIDIILTTVRPEQFILGKTLGILLASLCQLGLWLVIIYGVLNVVISYLGLEINIEPSRLGLSLVFTILGMLFYGFIYAGAGSFKSDPNEETGLKVFLSVIQLVIFYSLIFFLPSASDAVWNIVSAVPFLMPFLIPFTLASGEPQLGLLALYLALMLLSTFVALKIAARLLRLRCMYIGQTVGQLTLLKKAFLGQVE